MDGVIWGIIFTGIGGHKRQPESIKLNVDSVKWGRDAI